jgi:pimeloyl-CoA synthetase
MDDEKRRRVVKMLLEQYEIMSQKTTEAVNIKKDGREVICKLTEILGIANDVIRNAIVLLDEPGDYPELLN